MPEKKTVERAREAKREGKSPSTQAGEFVREEIHHIREGKHGASSPEQAIAIGLSKARRAGVDLPAPDEGEASEDTRQKAKSDLKKGRRPKRSVSAKRSRASTKRLKRKSRSSASKSALSSHAKKAARRRSASDRSASARKASRTKGPATRSRAAKKAARTRAKRK
jgi:hypothetical protein